MERDNSGYKYMHQKSSTMLNSDKFSFADFDRGLKH